MNKKEFIERYIEKFVVFDGKFMYISDIYDIVGSDEIRAKGLVFSPNDKPCNFKLLNNQIEIISVDTDIKIISKEKFFDELNIKILNLKQETGNMYKEYCIC